MANSMGMESTTGVIAASNEQAKGGGRWNKRSKLKKMSGLRVLAQRGWLYGVQRNVAVAGGTSIELEEKPCWTRPAGERLHGVQRPSEREWVRIGDVREHLLAETIADDGSDRGTR
ncbi:hypothetical protein PAXRUDRAFT_29007 [Paxillus rubicundulus Ve08.2h10]|uniref:Uncharacterized protein n=1 Tax=Paxillus rubicundulus Ve08.2h10 TaxID=930991 RepID=A0A0D0CLG7_9AGAM|nr:hypothetical protein PAXRUDRAFT_29007 [Paxillus rubicundulus Ve08.2h10]